jgi:hypothetical protein
MSGGAPIDGALRDRLRAFADVLIPAGHDMPAASEVGVADRQLDVVLGARPDLAGPLARAVERVDPADYEGSLARLHDEDRAAHEALLLTVVGGYYIDRDVRRRLGYTGQVPVEVRPEIIPNYVEEGLVEPLLARGPIYRPVPGANGLTSGSSIADYPLEGADRRMTSDEIQGGG